MADPPSPSPTVPPSPGRVTDRRLLPPGVVPRHLQQWVLIGIALVMVSILAFSGPPAKPRATTALSAAAVAVDPNQQRIEEYQRRIQEQAQRLAAEQAQLQLTKDALGGNPPPTNGAAPRRSLAESSSPTVSAPPAGDTHEDRARFADNVAFSRSSLRGGAEAAPAASGSTVDPALALLIPPPVPLPPLAAGLPGLPGGVTAPTAPNPT